MKKIFCALLALLLLAAIGCGAACGAHKSGGSAAQGEPPAPFPAEGVGETAEGAPPAGEQAPAPEKKLWLTFDDGPTDSTTPKILDILKTENVKATFFVVGRQIAGREEILRREAAEGHAVGIHTYSHEYKKIYASEEALLRDIERCRRAIRTVLPDFDAKLYRFPGGSFGVRKSLVAAVENAGYRFFDWNASADDAVAPNAPASVLYQNILASAGSKNEVILLMHDGVGYKETIKCLPAVIGYFREGGYRFCTL